jgi:hypothetical protein
LDPDNNPTMDSGRENARMNIDISGRRPGEKLLYTGPHLCVTCAEEGRTVNLPLKAGEAAPACKHCGARAVWEP